MGGDRHSFLDGGGEMAARVREHDWAATPLGPIGTWPAALRISLGLALNSAFPKCLFWGKELIAIHNDAFRPILGSKQDTLGRPAAEVWPEVWDEIAPLFRRAMAGEASFHEDFPLTVNRHGYDEETFFTFCYSPVRDENGRVCGVMDTVVETTSKVQAERTAKLRNRELLHRIKNMVSVVAVIANQTHRSAQTAEEARDRLASCLGSLARAQNLLGGDSADAAPIREVVEGSLAPFTEGLGRIAVRGPSLELTGGQVFALALALNELATNASKYGALSAAGGRVDLVWRVRRRSGERQFHMEWRESGGPEVAATGRQGFGSYLIREVLAQDFNGQVEIATPPEGLRCALVASWPRETGGPRADAKGGRAPEAAGRPPA